MTDSTTHLIGWIAVAVCMAWAVFSIIKQKNSKP